MPIHARLSSHDGTVCAIPRPQRKGFPLVDQWLQLLRIARVLSEVGAQLRESLPGTAGEQIELEQIRRGDGALKPTGLEQLLGGPQLPGLSALVCVFHVVQAVNI